MPDVISPVQAKFAPAPRPDRRLAVRHPKFRGAGIAFTRR
jgi:hypothetical protein